MRHTELWSFKTVLKKGNGCRCKVLMLPLQTLAYFFSPALHCWLVSVSHDQLPQRVVYDLRECLVQPTVIQQLSQCALLCNHTLINQQDHMTALPLCSICKPTCASLFSSLMPPVEAPPTSTMAPEGGGGGGEEQVPV